MQEAVDWHRTLVSAMQYISRNGWSSGQVARRGGAMDKREKFSVASVV